MTKLLRSHAWFTNPAFYALPQLISAGLAGDGSGVVNHHTGRGSSVCPRNVEPSEPSELFQQDSNLLVAFNSVTAARHKETSFDRCGNDVLRRGKIETVEKK